MVALIMNNITQFAAASLRQVISFMLSLKAEGK